MVVAVCVAVVPVLGQEAEVDREEVLRLGNMVQHVGGIESDPVDLFVEAMGPPASDADKWFLSVYTMQGCAPCQQLKSDWATSPWLLALADPNDSKKSWAHYNVFSREDQSQAFRIEKLQIEAFPTIVVQPPRSGRYGDPQTVVYQGTYGGDPEKLARQITAAIRLYVSKLEPPLAPEPPVQQAPEGAGRFDPPWQPPPKVEPRLPDFLPVFPDSRPVIPPNLNPTDLLMPRLFRWGTVGTVIATILLTLLVVWGSPRALQAVRQWQTASRQRSMVSDDQFQQSLQALRPAATPAADPSNKPAAPTA
jgi:hypothetical protein